MTDDFEKRMREKAEALLLARTSAPAKARPRTGAERLKLKQQLARAKRTRARRAAAKRRELKQPRRDLRRKGQGVTLAERMLARTDPGKWYRFGQLRALLPEATIGGVKAIVFQKLPDLGWIERQAIVANPTAQWLNVVGDPKQKNADGVLNGAAATIAPRYVYRIGAQQAVERASARERLSAVTMERFGGERALVGEFGDFSDL